MDESFKMRTLLILFVLAGGAGVFDIAAAPSPVITYQNDTLIIEAKDLTVQELVGELERECRITFKGLDEKLDEKISFEYEGESLEDAVKLMLRNIGESNYVFEYGRNYLIRVSVMPSSKHAPSRAVPQDRNRPPVHGRAVRVVSVINNSQAESLGLKPGDLIIEYDGVRIESSQQLIREVKNKSDLNQVEMVVVRDESPIRYYLKGGLIGVRINTMRTPPGKMEQYFR